LIRLAKQAKAAAPQAHPGKGGWADT
jgi:hypothetical protein